jgi:PAS domain S-box-containing protein
MARQLAALNVLAREEQLQTGDFEAALRHVVETVARTLEVERVSVWRFIRNRSAIRCLALYELNLHRHSSGLELEVSGYPRYFSALNATEVVAADDARRDDRTCELAEPYLKPFGITSMMDAPIHSASGLDGVLCHEHVGPVRQWAVDEKMFAVAVANLVSLLLGHREYRRAEETLRESEERLRLALRAARVGVWDWDILTGRVTWSDNVEALFGMAPGSFTGSYADYLDRIHPEDRDFVSQSVKDAVEAGKVYDIEHRVLWPDDSIHWVACKGDVFRDEAGRALRMSGTVMCITARRRAEEALGQSEELLRQAQKMEAIGNLAGGIAHDFNNLLTIISGCSELLLMRLGQQEPARRYLEEIKKAGDRAAALTHQLLAFSRRQVLIPKALDLNAIVEGMGTMLQRLLGEDIDLAAMLDPALWRVKADPGQLEQIIMNLAVNARDAMPLGGKLTIETANVHLKEPRVRDRLVMASGRYAMLAVSDTGVGMDAATQARVFEPFFTTKEIGKGTGLGLATVYGIVKQSGGYIFVYSEPGRGATFKVYLPRVEETAEAVGKEAAPSPLPRGTETILLVEDEPGVRTLACTALLLQGYTVLEARHGIEALLISHQQAGPIHLLVTDVVMPQMSGREVVKQLVAQRPSLKTLYVSGYAEDAIVHHGVLDPGTFFLQKPFTPETLARKVREVLDAE